MPVERRGWVIAFEIGSTGNGRNPIFNGRRQPSCGGTSRMTRECQVRICERLGVKFPGPTRPFPAKLTQNVLIASSAGRNNPLLVLDRFASLGFRRGGRLGRVRGSHETRCLVPPIPSPLQ